MSESSGGSQTASEAGGGDPPSPNTSVVSSSPPNPDKQSSGGSEAERLSALTPNDDQLVPDEKSPTQETTVCGGSGEGLVTGMNDNDELYYDAQASVGSINGSDVPKLQKRRKEGQCSEEEIQKEGLQREQQKTLEEVAKSNHSQKPVVADTEVHPFSKSDRQRVSGTGRGAAPEDQVKVLRTRKNLRIIYVYVCTY